MPEIVINLPSKLDEGIKKLVKEGYFNSVEDFGLHAVRLLAEIYGVAVDGGGVKLFDKIMLRQRSVISSTTMLSDEDEEETSITKEEKIVLGTFGSAKYEYENTLFMQYQMNALRTGQKPMSREEFIELLNSLKDKGILTRIEQNNKILWKKTS